MCCLLALHWAGPPVSSQVNHCSYSTHFPTRKGLSPEVPPSYLPESFFTQDFAFQQIQKKMECWRGRSRLLACLQGDQSSVPSTHIRWLTGTFNSRSRGSDSLRRPLRVAACTQHACTHTCTQRDKKKSYKNTFKNKNGN